MPSWWGTRKNCPRSRTEVRPTVLPSLLIINITLTLDLGPWTRLSFPGELSSWPTDVPTVKVKGRLVQKLEWKLRDRRTDMTDWVVVLRSTQHKTGHLGDISIRQSLGLVWKKLNLPQQKHAFTNKRNVLQHKQQQQQQPFNGLFSRTTWVSRYQKGKTDLDFTGARDSEWQWHQLGHMQVYTSLQTDNHASTPPLCSLQAGCPSCRPTNSVKALKALPI